MWKVFIFFAALERFLCSIYGENLAFHCEVFRFTAGALFRQEGVIMKGHVKKTTNSSSLIQCGQQCLLHTEWCVSVNFYLNQIKNDTPRICELNDFGVQSPAEIIVGKAFEYREGYIFTQLRPYQYGCNSNPCQNGATCYNDCASREVKCRCTDSAYGKFCENINDCISVVCKNGGTCKDLVNDFTCSCVIGYTGRNCETNINDCNEVVCKNGGTCQDLVNNFTCSCVTGFTGRNCETNVNECSGVVCQNGGTCKDLVNDFTCSCVVGYIGRHCGTNVDDCNNVVCQNGGTCKDLVNNFTCSCLVGYTGRNCEINVDDCSGDVCKNGGTCQDLVNDFACSCVTGYTGKRCETNIDDCNGVVCQNGGTCVDLVNDFKCSCVAGYAGKLCESDLDECASKPCLNGGTCNNLFNKFTCTCPETHHGNMCKILSACDIIYSTFSTNNVILYPLSTNLQAFTLCSWFKLKDSRDLYPLSYLQSSSSLGIGLMGDGRIMLKVNGYGRYNSLGILRDGNWQHLCIAWRSSDGAVQTYRNGALKASSTGFMSRSTVNSGNTLNIGRRADLGSCFTGKISNFNVWSSFLDGEKILSMSSSCRPLDSEGNVVSWSALKKKTFSGSVEKRCPGSCFS